MICTTKGGLEFLAKNPEGPVSDLKQIHPKLTKGWELIGYLRVGENNYKFTKEGMKTYKEIYSPVNWIEGLAGLFFSKVLRVN